MNLGLDLGSLRTEQRPTGAWVAALLHALARDEQKGVSPQRITEPGLATWRRFRGRLSIADFTALLFEDASILYPVPFDARRMDADFRIEDLPVTFLEERFASLSSSGSLEDSRDYLVGQARILGLPHRLGRSDLHAVKPHHRVLELPGTGGQLAHHVVATNPGLSLTTNLTVGCASWQEFTMAGVVALDLRAPSSGFASAADPGSLSNPAHALRRTRFDFVLGLSPEKGGQFRVEDQLAIWFSGATVLLV